MGTFWLVLGGCGRVVLAALICEVVMTMRFLAIILGVTDKRAPAGFAPIAIGLGLTLIHHMASR
jgi:aquaporin Z